MARRGSKPGERRGGRKKGTPNKATKEIRELAREYTIEALEALYEIATGGESEAARVSAANAILDRGYGKPAMPVVMRRLADMSEKELIDFLGYDPGSDELRTLAGTPTVGSA